MGAAPVTCCVPDHNEASTDLVIPLKSDLKAVACQGLTRIPAIPLAKGAQLLDSEPELMQALSRFNLMIEACSTEHASGLLQGSVLVTESKDNVQEETAWKQIDENKQNAQEAEITGQGVSKPNLSKIGNNKLSSGEKDDDELHVQLDAITKADDDELQDQLDAVMKAEEENERLQVQIGEVMKHLASVKEQENERLQLQLRAVEKQLACVCDAKTVNFEALANEPAAEPAATPLEGAVVADTPEASVASVPCPKPQPVRSWSAQSRPASWGPRPSSPRPSSPSSSSRTKPPRCPRPPSRSSSRPSCPRPPSGEQDRAASLRSEVQELVQTEVNLGAQGRSEVTADRDELHQMNDTEGPSACQPEEMEPGAEPEPGQDFD